MAVDAEMETTMITEKKAGSSKERLKPFGTTELCERQLERVTGGFQTLAWSDDPVLLNPQPLPP